MENATYAALTRQSGLMREMQMVAHNIANASTTGYRAENMMFSEFVSSLGPQHDSLSMATGRVGLTNTAQGALSRTDATFDLAIEGDGYFLIETPQGQRLTRAGSFTPDANGELVTPDGYRVLDAGGAPVFVPANAGQIGIGADGTISADGQPVGQIGVVVPNAPATMTRQAGTLFDAPDGFAPAANVAILQGYVENSNVNTIDQISRMIAVQRAYELGQSFIENEDERMRSIMQAIGR